MTDELRDALKANSRFTDVERLILLNVEEFGFAPSKLEADTLAEVLALPRVTVTRPPESELLAIGMIPNDCHANCAMQAANDIEGNSRHVTGWYVSGDCLVLHSVAEISGQWFCLTPQIVKGPETFEFIPDRMIEWRDTADGLGREPYRNGERLPQALRENPELHFRMCDEFKSLVASGMSIMDARARVDTMRGGEIPRIGRL